MCLGFRNKNSLLSSSHSQVWNNRKMRHRRQVKKSNIRLNTIKLILRISCLTIKSWFPNINSTPLNWKDLNSLSETWGHLSPFLFNSTPISSSGLGTGTASVGKKMFNTFQRRRQVHMSETSAHWAVGTVSLYPISSSGRSFLLLGKSVLVNETLYVPSHL